MAEEKKGLFGSLGDKLKAAADSKKAQASDAAAKVKEDAKQVTATAKSTAAGAVSAAKTKTANTVDAAKSGTVSAVNAAKSTTAAKVSSTTSAVKSATSAVKSSASTAKAVTSAVKTTASTVAENVSSAAAKSVFSDVPANAYYAPAVQWAVQRKITSGTTETTFSPDNPCTRGHAAAFLWRFKGSPAPEMSASPFSDVSEGVFYQAILWVNENNIITGVTDSTFAPGEPCTRAQVLTYLLRMKGMTGITEAGASKWAKDNGLFAGMSGDAKDPCTRADIVTFLYRAQNK